MPLLQQLQFFNLLLLVILGYFTAHLYLSMGDIFIVLLFSVLWEHFLIYLKHGSVRYFSFSALTTALGVMLMMVTTHIWIYMVVIAAGLFQKHYLHYRGKHIFNPSNFAIIAALLFFYQQAHVVLGQLGDAYWLIIVVLVLGVIVLIHAKRWLIPIIFVLSYLLLQYIFIVSSDPVLLFEDITSRFYSVSFIVFMLFMLTDPHTTPKFWKHQVLFGFSVAFFATFLDYFYGFRVQHLFLSLFWISALRIVCCDQSVDRKKTIFKATVLVLALSVIIYIQMQSPYYFEMEG